MAGRASGTEGYAENATTLIANWRQRSFADKPRPVLDLLPDRPSLILDVGAGIGIDAAALAAAGHTAVAVEPVDELRVAGMALHRSPAIEWIADSLPDLGRLTAEGRSFDVILLSAVWMHLDETERRRAMPVVVALLRPGGRIIMSLRHGPVPSGRRMFEVAPEETIRLAEAERLQCVLRLTSESAQQANRQAGVSWTHLAFAFSSFKMADGALDRPFAYTAGK